jgi:hypothetical protein
MGTANKSMFVPALPLFTDVALICDLLNMNNDIVFYWIHLPPWFF